MLDLWQQSAAIASRPQPNEGGDLPATFGESYDAAWAQGDLASSSIKETNARNAAIAEYSDQIKRAGGDVNGEYASRLTAGAGGEYGQMEPDGLDVANTALAKLKAKNPGVQIAPLTEDDIGKRAVQLSQGAIAASQSVDAREQTLASRAGSFLGAAGSAAADPINLPLMAIAPEDSVGILGHALQFGAGGAAGQAVNEVLNRAYNEKVQPGYGAGQAAANVLEAGVSGAVLGGTMRALGAALEHFTTQGLPTAAKDAVNVLRSEAQIDTSNVLPGVQGEAEHRMALGRSIDDILNGHAIDPEIAQAGRDVIERAQRDTAFIPPHFDAEEIGRISDEAGLRARSKEIDDTLGALPAGDATAADRLNRLGVVESELANAQTPAERRALSDRRDQILVDTTPEKLRDAAAPIEQRGQAEAEQAQIATRLQEIESDRAQAQLQRAISGTTPEPTASRIPRAEPPTLFDIHTGRIDALMDMREGARGVPETSPELPYRVKGITNGVTALAQLGGHDMPADEAEALAERIMASRTPEEARFILNQITDRPRTLAATLPSPADFAAADREAARTAPAPAQMSAAEIRETLVSPQAHEAMRADIERAIDEAAKSGKALKVPVAVDADGNAVMQSATSMLDDVDARKALADAIEQCALPGAARAEEE